MPPSSSTRRRCTIFAKPRVPFIVAKGGCVGLATAGSGYVMAGIIGGLLARGADPVTATLWGIHLHGAAGQRLTGGLGPLGFLARELLAEVPGLLAELS
jgi:NAD(P)H-hydrate repair Nnr-like enzyme with NAD(P)H-hydrate dehydratase domain